jgi:excisionase family DNA binding protein
MKNYLNVRSLSGYIGLSKSSIYKKVMRKEIPFIKATGSLLFEIEEIDNWLKKHRHDVKIDVTNDSPILKPRRIQ